jgi:hypothetical protein
MSRFLLRLAALGCLALVACSGRGTAEAPSTGLPVPIVSILPTSTSGPYVVVAVDNHFHGIHVDDRNEIGEDRPFIVKNEGRNLHNFTVVGTDVSVDLQPGTQFEWPRIGDVLPVGSYQVICKYHQAYWNMGGRFDVIP